MSLWNSTKGLARFVFVKIPGGILGLDTLRQNNQTIKALYESLRNPVCPLCSGGVLSMLSGHNQEHDNPNVNYTWACNRCDFMILGSRDKDSITPILTKIRQEQSLSLFDGLEDAEREKLTKVHTLHSRIFFGAALAFFIGFLWMLWANSTMLLSINWCVLALCMFIFGLKNSYRAWQVENGVLYVKGAFKSWFANEKWLR